MQPWALCLPVRAFGEGGVEGEFAGTAADAEGDQDEAEDHRRRGEEAAFGSEGAACQEVGAGLLGG